MTRLQRLFSFWVYGGFILSFLLLALLFIYASSLTLLEILLCLHLPAYMWHQYEEHDGDRFKAYLDQRFFPEILNQGAIFFINVIGVWALFAILILMALNGPIGLGLGVAYLTFFNAITHVISAAKFRSYNPGLLTSIIFFIPISGYALVQAIFLDEIPLAYHIIGLVVGIGVHALIVMYALVRLKKLK
ncbi:MAG: HXXEE domain-containing protein [Verrucomicrobiota bacterium]